MSLAPAWRRARPDDAPLAWLWAAAVVSALVLAPFARWFAPFSPACLLHVWTGVPCPTCGSTRAVVALAAFDVPGALAWNPLVTLGLLVFGVAGLAAPLWVAVRAPLPRGDEHARRWVRVALPVALAANWLYLMTHGV